MFCLVFEIRTKTMYRTGYVSLKHLLVKFGSKFKTLKEVQSEKSLEGYNYQKIKSCVWWN